MAKDKKARQLATMKGVSINSLKPSDDKSINIRAIENGFLVRISGYDGKKKEYKEREVYAPDQAGVDKILGT